MEQYGKIKIHLAQLLQEKGLSKNKFSQRAEMQRTQLNHYCNNTVTRLDIDVLGRICTVLDCSIGDLLEFLPPEPDSK
ncbi:MAG: helix-turn-helix transcriptional regulator [Oscillospiraceae bacterium]|jgi:putative transcriptional regulator|nr:helix-turn-helix transcriptional regulator [Oscillospiraceae bacterium]MCI9395109.1 helix-turn-helix transcriptional regulator [Oscillospiraceae bacterium]MCI9580569.1 helix-turn-helix transcriptional regulator [Oscillospiraceae bacterium]